MSSTKKDNKGVCAVTWVQCKEDNLTSRIHYVTHGPFLCTEAVLQDSAVFYYKTEAGKVKYVNPSEWCEIDIDPLEEPKLRSV